MKSTFSSWLKEKTTATPSIALDEKILSAVRGELTGASSPSFFAYNWKLTGFAVSASIALAIVLTFKLHEINESKKMVINESPEMIMNYKNMELMVATADLSDEDWDKIEGIR